MTYLYVLMCTTNEDPELRKSETPRKYGDTNTASVTEEQDLCFLMDDDPLLCANSNHDRQLLALKE
jgi:hypothetical protein